MDFFSPSQALSTFILFPFHMQLTEGANQVSTSQLCLLIIVITGIIDWLFDVRAVFERDIKSECVGVRVFHHLNNNCIHSEMSQKQEHLPL